MEITEVRIKLVGSGNDKLKAFCSITIDDCFVVRDLKIIEGSRGPFVAMPSRKLTERCPYCSGKNHHRALYCNDCGKRLPEERRKRLLQGGNKLHADVAHPINTRCREMIQERVLEVYRQELKRSLEPGYRPLDIDEDFDDYYAEEGEVAEPELEPMRGPRASLREWEGGGRKRGGSRPAERGPAEEVRRRLVEETASWRSEEADLEGRHGGGGADGLDSAAAESAEAGAERKKADERRRLEEIDYGEPEDNFGAGLFS